MTYLDALGMGAVVSLVGTDHFVVALIIALGFLLAHLYARKFRNVK